MFRISSYLRIGWLTGVIFHLMFMNSKGGDWIISCDTSSKPVFFGVLKLKETLEAAGLSPEIRHFSMMAGSGILIISDSVHLYQAARELKEILPDSIRAEGYQMVNPGNTGVLIIAARDGTGAMYGLLGLNNFIQTGKDLFEITPIIENPFLEYRIIKFNLPWSPYRDHPATRLHLETCRDLKFWEKFLDMMAENRFNVLSLWNLHPFPYMIRPVNFPRATPFTDTELESWSSFWKELFGMAKNRGIQTFMVNWNIVVSPDFAKNYGAQEFNDTSRLVRQYTRECVTQVINEYPDLTGIGVTLADWMNNFNGSMSAKEREDWIEETFIEGMKQADRKVKFLHRSVLSGSPMEMRRVIDHAQLAQPALVEIKFNWSHGHSTPGLHITHDYHSGEIDERFWEPEPVNYKIQWMIRNEDFFILRWGQPEFIREHILSNTPSYVNGYFVGSEGYLPALDYSSLDFPGRNWQYGFEKQWLFYLLWGRFMYNPRTPDTVFEQAFDLQFGKGSGKDFLKAYSLASKMPLKLASFYRATWDYTLYAEGFLAPRPSAPDSCYDASSSFISVDELICHETLDPALLSIHEFCRLEAENIPVPENTITPLQLADQLEQDGKNAIGIIENLKENQVYKDPNSLSEMEDVLTWSYLSLYFGEKLRGAVALQRFRLTGNNKNSAISHLQSASRHWRSVMDHTRHRYRATPLVSLPGNPGEDIYFSWWKFFPEVEQDIKIAESAIREF